jgi:L-aspartate semialdehyde sulfurtransferase ferredoxin
LYSKLLVLHFPSREVEKPTICDLVRLHDLTFNILKAKILPRKEGIMVLELSGSRKNFDSGIKYLKEQGVIVRNASSEVNRLEDRCIQCGACTAVCPTGALAIKRPEMTVIFEKNKCSVCELCLSTCVTRAMEIKPTTETFF